MADTNNFKDTVSALFKGMDGVVSSKTVVGEAIHTDGVTILPLLDVSFGLGVLLIVTKKRKVVEESEERLLLARCW